MYYSKKNTFWFDILKSQFSNANLEPIYEGLEADYKNGMIGFFNSINDEDSYNKYLDHIIKVIRTRTESIETWLAKNKKKPPQMRGIKW